MVTIEMLRRLWPRAPLSLVEAVAQNADGVFARFGINTPLRVAHFLAQISHESAGGTVTAESLNYSSPARIAAVWPKRFTPDSARPFVHNERALADRVYNGRMGNAEAGDDGFNFRGRGLLQITGRTSYRTIGGKCALALEHQPELAFDPAHALFVAAAEFVHLGCLPFCDADNVVVVTRRVNGGLIGLDSRKAWLTRWKLAIPQFPGDLPATDDELHEIAPVDHAPVPRGGDNDVPDAPAKLTQSKTVTAQIGTATSVGLPAGAAVIKAATDAAPDPSAAAPSASDIITHASDVIAKGNEIAEQAPQAISLGKTVLHFLSDPFVAAVFALVALGFVAFTILERRRKLKEEGA